MEGVWGVTRR